MLLVCMIFAALVVITTMLVISFYEGGILKLSFPKVTLHWLYPDRFPR